MAHVAAAPSVVGVDRRRRGRAISNRPDTSPSPWALRNGGLSQRPCVCSTPRVAVDVPKSSAVVVVAVPRLSSRPPLPAAAESREAYDHDRPARNMGSEASTILAPPASVASGNLVSPICVLHDLAFSFKFHWRTYAAPTLILFSLPDKSCRVLIPLGLKK